MSADPAEAPACRVFIVEDEAMMVFLLEDMLTELGHQVVAVAHSVAEGVQLAETVEVDLALLDVNLRGSMSWPIAERLAARGIPFVFSTGYQLGVLPPQWRSRPWLQKPFLLAGLQRSLIQALTMARPTAS